MLYSFQTKVLNSWAWAEIIYSHKHFKETSIGATLH